MLWLHYIKFKRWDIYWAYPSDKAKSKGTDNELHDLWESSESYYWKMLDRKQLVINEEKFRLEGKLFTDGCKVRWACSRCWWRFRSQLIIEYLSNLSWSWAAFLSRSTYQINLILTVGESVQQSSRIMLSWIHRDAIISFALNLIDHKLPKNKLTCTSFIGKLYWLFFVHSYSWGLSLKQLA